MRRAILLIAIATTASLAAAQDLSDVVIPDSSIEKPGDIGVRMHTNYFMHVPDPRFTPHSPPPGLTVETPGSIGCIYDLVSSQVSGCPVATATEVPSGGSETIVIVDAYDYPNSGADLATFNTEWGLPSTTLVKKYATGHKPPDGCASGWELEESLDIQWAHANGAEGQDRADGGGFKPHFRSEFRRFGCEFLHPKSWRQGGNLHELGRRRVQRRNQR